MLGLAYRVLCMVVPCGILIGPFRPLPAAGAMTLPIVHLVGSCRCLFHFCSPFAPPSNYLVPHTSSMMPATCRYAAAYSLRLPHDVCILHMVGILCPPMPYVPIAH
jgi:hypothetical protein